MSTARLRGFKRRSLPLLIRAIPKPLARICHSDHGRVPGIATVPCAEPFDADDVTRLHSVACPAAPNQRVDTEKLYRPALHVIVVILDVDVEPRVGIRPLDSSDRARQLDGPVDVELGGK